MVRLPPVPLDLPPGLTARPPRPDDVDTVQALVVACELAVLGRSDVTPVQTASDLTAPGYDRERGGLLVLDGRGRAVGWLWSDDDPEAGRVFVDPYASDRELLGALVAYGLAYVRSLAVERGRPLEVSAGSYEHDERLGTALAGAGLQVCRHFWRMEVQLTPTRSWVAPEPPPGVALRRPDPADEETYRLLHRLHDEAFAEHWGHVDRSFEAWRERFDNAPGNDPTQWWVADLDGVPVGLLVGDDSRVDLGVGWVRTLGVVPAGRGRGVATALLRQAFGQAAGAGRTAVALAVDSANTTGATALYESVGMSVDTVQLSWRGEVASG